METLINNTEFAQRLQKIMETHELSATSFAEKLEVGRATISHLMSGRNKPSLDFVMKVVASFPEIGLEWLLYGRESTSKTTSTTLHNSSKSSEQSAQELTSKRSNSSVIKTEENSLKELTSFASSNVPIKRIVIFLKDGTFESYEMGS